MGRNKKACAPYAEHDIGHDADGAAEVRLKVYATEHPETRPNMRFVVGRVMDFAGTQKVVDEGHWTQSAPYLGDIDPLRFYNALSAQQRELEQMQRMWDDRRKKEQPPLSCFGFRDLLRVTHPEPVAPAPLPEQAAVETVEATPVIEKPAKAPRAPRAPKPVAKAWTPEEVMAYFAKK